MRLGAETGSLVNHVYGSSSGPAAKVGMGCTILGWTDRHAATIVKVTRTQVHVREDHAVRTDRNGMSECQEYDYNPNPDACVQVFRMTKRGYRCHGRGLTLGVRRHYYDYSF